MDAAGLSHLLTSSYSPDQNVRIAAEHAIRKLEGQDSLVPLLIHVLTSDHVPIATRQAAAVYLKNLFTQGRLPLSSPAYAALKPAILQLLGTSPTASVTAQLRTTLGLLIKAAWPGDWVELEGDVQALLVSQGTREVYVGLLALLEMLKAFRYSANALAASLTARTFPLLLPIGNRSLSPNPTVQDAVRLHLIFKCYWMSIQQQLTPHLQESESIMPWGNLLLQMASHHVPLSTPPDNEELSATHYWKAKKWALRILNRLFRKYGNPSQLPALLRRSYIAFAQKFVTAFAPEILRRYLALADAYCRGSGWLTDKCLVQVIQFFSDCVKPKTTWELLKPHVADLVRLLIFPQLCFTERKKELWDADPVAFVQASLDNFEDLGWPDESSIALLLSLARNRSKTAYPPILAHISDVLSSASPNSQAKYGALVMVVALEDVFVRHPLSKSHVEGMVVQFVVPEMGSECGYLRSAACEVIATFEDPDRGFKWSSTQNIVNTFQKLIYAMQDPELPVRVSASFAFSNMMERPEVRHLIAPNIGQVMQGLLKLSDELGLDTLSDALDNVVKNFAEELKTLAIPIVSHLRDSYMQLLELAEAAQANEEDANADETTDKVMAAIGVLRTIGVVVDSQKDSPELLEAIQALVAPLIVHTLDRGNVGADTIPTTGALRANDHVYVMFLPDMFDEVYTLTDDLLSHLQRISPYMWRVFELTYQVFKSVTIDYFADMMPVLDGFINKGADVLARNPDYCRMIVDMYETVAMHDEAGAFDRKNASMIAESFVMQVPGVLAQFVGELVAGGIHIITVDGAETPHRAQKMDALLSVLVCYPAEFLHAIQRQNVLPWFFGEWIAFVPRMDRVHDLQLTIGAVCALLELPPGLVPPLLAEGQGWAQVVSAALQAFTMLPGAVKSRDEMAQKEAENVFEEEEDTDDMETVMDASEEIELEPEEDEKEEEEDDVWDEESQYLEMLAEEGARLQAKNAAREQGLPPPPSDSSSEEEEEDSDADEEGADYFYETAVDKVDPYMRFMHALGTFQMRNAGGYSVVTTGLSREMQVALMEVGARAGQRERAG